MELHYVTLYIMHGELCTDMEINVSKTNCMLKISSMSDKSSAILKELYIRRQTTLKLIV